MLIGGRLVGRSLSLSVRKLLAIAGHPGYWRGFLHGVAAGAEHDPVLRGLNCSTVIDIGANRGQFALAARRSFPNAHIFSFEPLPGPAARFRVVHINDSRVTLHELAIGPERREATINVSRQDDSSSLLPISAGQEAVFPGTYRIGSTAVRVGPLSDFVEQAEIVPPALLKVDVQGYELQALKGSEALLHLIEHVYAECSFVELYAGQALAHEVIEWLHSRSFRISGVYNMVYDRDGHAIQADFMFSKL